MKNEANECKMLTTSLGYSIAKSTEKAQLTFIAFEKTMRINFNFCSSSFFLFFFLLVLKNFTRKLLRVCG